MPQCQDLDTLSEDTIDVTKARAECGSGCLHLKRGGDRADQLDEQKACEHFMCRSTAPVFESPWAHLHVPVGSPSRGGDVTVYV